MMENTTTRMGRKLAGYWHAAAIAFGQVLMLNTDAKREYNSAKHQTYGWYGRQNITKRELRRQAMAWEAGVKSGEVLSKAQRKGINTVPGRSKMMRAAGCNTKHSIAKVSGVPPQD